MAIHTYCVFCPVPGQRCLDWHCRHCHRQPPSAKRLPVHEDGPSGSVLLPPGLSADAEAAGPASERSVPEHLPAPMMQYPGSDEKSENPIPALSGVCSGAVPAPEALTEGPVPPGCSHPVSHVGYRIPLLPWPSVRAMPAAAAVRFPMTVIYSLSGSCVVWLMGRSWTPFCCHYIQKKLPEADFLHNIM